MNELEANALLTKAGLIDPRSKTQADRAIAWAEVLDDVSLEDGLHALREHLRTSTEPILPAHILRQVRARATDQREREAHRETQASLSAPKNVVPMPADLREKLAADAKRERAKLKAILSGPIPVRLLPKSERRDGIAKARAELDAIRQSGETA